MSQTQKVLSTEQTKEFYHDLFVTEQVAAFVHSFSLPMRADDLVVDLGGGCGFFAGALKSRAQVATRVIDTDPQSVAVCHASGIDAQLADALKPAIRGDETIACFNMVLHHLVGDSDAQTGDLQTAALRAWQAQVRHVFVNEYVYESFFAPGLSGWLIWCITSSQKLSAWAKVASRWMPSLRANTLGVGVRFRPVIEWRNIFQRAGFDVVAHVKGKEEPIALPRRLLLIRSGRRDYFVLRPHQGGAAV